MMPLSPAFGLPVLRFSGASSHVPSDGENRRSTDDIITDELLLIALRRIKSQDDQLTPYTRGEEATDDYQMLARGTSGLFEVLLNSAFFRMPGMADKRQQLHEELTRYKKALKWFVRQMYEHTDLLLRSAKARNKCLTRLNGAWMNVKYLFGTSRSDEDVV